MDFINAVKELELDDPDPPNDPEPNNAIQVETWKMDIKDYCAKMQEYANFHAGLYNVVLGQCTEVMFKEALVGKGS